MTFASSCITCGAWFLTNSAHINRALEQRYCSRSCQADNLSAQKRRRVRRTCRRCGADFEVCENRAARGGIYCSATCSHAGRRMPRANCETCNRPCSRPEQRFCSSSCVKRKARIVYAGTCSHCGDWFLARSSSAMFCDRHCSGKGRFRRHSTACAHCGRLFVAAPSRQRTFCSRPCADLARKRSLVPCLICGTKIVPQHRGSYRTGTPRIKTYCSAACAGLAKAKRYNVAGQPMTLREIASVTGKSINSAAHLVARRRFRCLGRGR